jgi:hypothetical protein
MSDEPVCICDHGRENIPCPIHNKPEKSKVLDIGQRWEQDIPHDSRSVKIYKRIEELDFKYGDTFCFKSGGDGDNGETLMYLLDMYFAEEDEKTEALRNVL